MSRIPYISFFVSGAIIEELVWNFLGIGSMIQQLAPKLVPIAILLTFAIAMGTLSYWVQELYKVKRKKRKETDLEKKNKTIEELKRLQRYIFDVRSTIDNNFLDNKSKHGCRELLEKYEWLVGKLDVDNDVSLTVIDDRIDRIIAKMEIYSYQESLNELGVKEPRKEWGFREKLAGFYDLCI